MTVATTAKEIAAEFSKTRAGDLELPILRHMEHHVLRYVEAEREACAKIADSYDTGAVAEAIAEAIRARAAQPKASIG